jgi:hypothetical protein
LPSSPPPDRFKLFAAIGGARKGLIAYPVNWFPTKTFIEIIEINRGYALFWLYEPQW